MSYKKKLLVLFGMLLLAIIAGCAPAGEAEEMPTAALPVNKAFADGKEIYFVHLEASDENAAQQMTEMMNSPTLYVPLLAKVPAEALANVYSIKNGVGGQVSVFDSPPNNGWVYTFAPVECCDMGGWGKGARVEVLSFDEACNLLGNYETAYHCLITRGRLGAGESVLILGASGATGLAAVQIAKLTGATVIATGRSHAKLALVAQQGADHVLVTETTEGGGVRSFKDQVKALTGSRGVDVVYDGVGGALSVESLRCTRFGARFLIVGWASTPFVAKGKGGRGAPNVNQLPTNLIIMKGLEVLGSPLVTCLVWALENPEMVNLTYEVGGAEYLTLRQVLETLMDVTHRRRLFLPLPFPYMRALIVLLGSLIPDFHVSTYWLDYVAVNRTCPVDNLPRNFGLMPARFAYRLDYLARKPWYSTLMERFQKSFRGTR